MQQSGESPQTNIWESIKTTPLKYWLGLVLTLIAISLVTWDIVLTKQLLNRMEHDSSQVTGYSTKRLDEMWMKINSIEMFIRTTPLVECGDHYGQGKVQRTDKQRR